MLDTKSTEFKVLKTAICHTWSIVGYDMQECCEDSGEPLDNEGAVEGCLDHITDAPDGKFAELIVDTLVQENSYVEVLKFLAKHIKLT